MSAAGNAETYARRVKNHQDANDKLDELAKAVAELARAVKQLDAKVDSRR